MAKRRYMWQMITILLSVVGVCGCDGGQNTSETAGVSAGEAIPIKENGFPDEFTNSIGIRFRHVPAGRFIMGIVPPPDVTKDPTFGAYRYAPLHEVRVKRGYYMATCEVTNKQYRSFDPEHHSGAVTYKGRKLSLDGDDQPVANVSWQKAVEFCRWLSKKEGRTYRLPSEAEWEYACRAGVKTGRIPSEEEMDDYAWTPQNSGWVTHPVGSKKPNVWGLYDMIGNVWEMCADWVAPYPGVPEDIQGRLQWPKPGSRRVIRGGHIFGYAHCGLRSSINPDELAQGVGFRIVCEPTVAPPAK